METFERTLELFLKELSIYTGKPPVIELDYSKKTIFIKESSSGFLRQMYANEATMLHLSGDGIKVEFFKR